MSPIAQIRRLRNLPRVLLAVLALAVAQTSLIPCAMAYGDLEQAVAVGGAVVGMEEHCAYCPPGTMPTDVDMGDCVYTHAPSVDVVAGSAQHVDSILSSPMLYANSFDVAVLRDSGTFVPTSYAPPPKARSLTLTHCVQLK